MEIQKEIELFEEILLANPDFDEALLSKDENNDYEDSSIADQLGFFQAGIEVAEREARMGAKAQAAPEVKPSHSITLTCAQLREAFMFGAPDKDDQEQLETEMTIVWSKEGHSGKGYYCYYSELPEEGAIFLDEVIEAQEQKG
ncbi:hypothetical protein [Acinetobacter sp.]|uniref:hypothetical protein n=1 Tax=Acinetobacter sp. TaxID=472 RepID=UPI003C78F8D7